MNGVDWAKAKDNMLNCSLMWPIAFADLHLGEMIGELSNSHTYVGGGDYPVLHPVNVGLLGADYEADTASGMYRIKQILDRRKLGPDFVRL